MNEKIENIKKELSNGNTCLDIIKNSYAIADLLENKEITEEEWKELTDWNFGL